MWFYYVGNGGNNKFRHTPIMLCLATFTLIYMLIVYILLGNKVISKWPYLYIKQNLNSQIARTSVHNS